MNEKVLKLAIECRMPLFWTVLPSWHGKRLELRVATALFESGAVRSRSIHRCAGLEEAFQISVRVYEQAGRLDCFELLASELNGWAVGWRPELNELREKVRDLGFRVGLRQQPLWDEFSARMREKGKER